MMTMEHATQTQSAVARRRAVTELQLDVVAEPESARRLRELSHDLRQPLAAIGALADAAASVVVGTSDPSDLVLCCLEQIGDETRELLLLCRHVLDQIDTAEPVPVHVVASDVVDRSRRAASCAIELESTPCVLRADPVELRRVLVNLLENAQRAAGPRGVVEVAVRVDDEHLVLEVGDSGAGFGRAPRGSSGLGLVVLERFAERHHGHVEIGTSRLGGALVACTVPLERDLMADGFELVTEVRA
jgi:signal transduction histidine kinase